MSKPAQGMLRESLRKKRDCVQNRNDRERAGKMGKETEKTRNYGIDLLRLVFMFMVCMLHVLGQGGILDASEEGSLRFGTFWLLEILSYCAVDGFAFISGYMSPDKPRKYEKLVEMWFQAFFYSFAVTLLLTAVGVNESLEKKDMIQCAFPVIFEKFWYFSAFFVLYFAIPILNRYLFAIKEATAQKTLLALFLLFSVLSVVRDVEDPFGVQDGYSAIWLIVLYCMGVLAKRIRLFETRKTASLLLLWALCVFLTWGRRVFANDERLVNYVSPTVLLSGIILVVLFSRLPVRGAVIGKLSPLTFGIYLFQLNQVLWHQVLKDAFAFVAEKNVAVGVAYIFVFAFAIFLSGLAVEFARRKLAKLCKIPALSRKIVELTNQVLGKAPCLLK